MIDSLRGDESIVCFLFAVVNQSENQFDRQANQQNKEKQNERAERFIAIPWCRTFCKSFGISTVYMIAYNRCANKKPEEYPYKNIKKPIDFL
ncbi:MAG: hypothetical protein IKO52_02580 [Clostridia bacterium]|nr:hypothetical protein [Clostridia bacterium]